MTLRSAQAGAAVYAVTWSQLLLEEGTPMFGGAAPSLNPETGEAEWPDGIPEDLLGLVRAG